MVSKLFRRLEEKKTTRDACRLFISPRSLLIISAEYFHIAHARENNPVVGNANAFPAI